MVIAYLLDQSGWVYRIMAMRSSQPAAQKAGPDDPLPLSAALLGELARALRAIRYGAIELVIHDGRVVQLERREKVRFDVEVTDRQR
jgi:hypothetical protein